MMKVGQRVITKYGNGTIVDLEGAYGTESNQWFRYGVKHDEYIKSYKGYFDKVGNEILYFFKTELQEASAAL
jgi:hypothetical protein